MLETTSLNMTSLQQFRKCCIRIHQIRVGATIRERRPSKTQSLDTVFPKLIWHAGTTSSFTFQHGADVSILSQRANEFGSTRIERADRVDTLLVRIARPVCRNANGQRKSGRRLISPPPAVIRRWIRRSTSRPARLRASTVPATWCPSHQMRRRRSSGNSPCWLSSCSPLCRPASAASGC